MNSETAGSLVASFEPAFLPIGTDVSAKYRGAFCEAKVKKLVKSVKCKIILKDTQVSVVVTDENITGPLKVGSTVEVKLPESGQQSEGIINKITDCSTYTVVFDDGDERTLRRTQLCLKGEKHFMESETLDNLPLSHPEHFGTPVLQNKKSRRTKPGEESESEEEMSSSEEETPRRASYKGRYQELVGKVMCMECTDKRKGGQCPVLVVLPDAHPMDVKPRDQLLVRSFRDAKFMYASRKELKEFSREIAIKNEDKNMKAAFEKALLYYDNHELPPNWKKQELLGSEDEDEGGDDDSSDDNEPSEQKDLFVAQLYKFMDDRSTPINKGPCIGNKDLNLYRLFRVVQAIGGYNKVTNQMKWRLVYSKMGLPPSNTASHQIKNAYKKYLHAFEDFYRKLGSTMGTISRPGRSRQSSSRSILAFRGRDKEPSPRSPRTEKTTVKDDKSKDEEKEKPKIKSEEGPRSEDTEDAGESTPVDESDTDIVRRSTPRREKAQKEEPAKIDKEKKEDVKIKKEDKKEEEKKEEKKEDVKEEKKKEDKREERKSLRQSLKEEERKEAGKGKEEDKKDVKKSEGRTDRVLRREREDKEDEGKKEGEEQKDNQKKRVTRRKSGRTEDDKKEGEDKEEKEEEKKVSEEKMNAEKKDKAEDKKERKDELKRPPSARKEKKTEIKKKPEDEEQPEKKDKDSEKPEEVESEADSASDNHNQDEYPAGTKLKVKYGRGRNQKIYEAKVVEAGKEGQHKNYLVHYAGWNTRYDEWVRPDRIVSVVDRPEMTKLKKKSMSPRSPKTTTKPDMPVLKKRGRNSLQQDQSPGNASAKMPVSSDGKTPKNKPPTTPGGSASKTRTTRSNSTEIKSEGLQAPAKNRITRRSSGLTDSMDAGSPGDQDVGSDSEPESEMAAPSGSGGDLVSERDDEDEGKEMELDTSIEEEETSDMKEVEDEPITSVEEADMDESRSEEPLAEEASEDNKDMPHIVPKDDSQENLLELSSLVLPDDSTITPLLADEENNDVTEGTKEDTTSLPEITKTSLEQQGTEESDEKLDESLPVLSQQTEEESAAKEVDTSNSSETPELDTKSETLPMPDNSDEDKNSSYEELAIPQLKKIDIDIVPVSEKREAKLDKVKSKKKDGKESKKGRQTEHRASFSEIPTLEPMTVVPDVKPCPSEVEPSPYDFNEPELDLPWQPEITKKWEPINKPHPVFRDGKIEFKKKASEKVESPAKDETASEPQQDKPVKKKGRKKKELSPDLKKEIQTYEDVVNSVVESYSTPEPEQVPFSPCAEKEEKPVKKRKNKSAENAESPSKMDTTKDTTESEKKQQGKGPKKIKGGKVVKKLNKKAKEGNS
ncbi:hypothetical protein C0Q70_13941 [Pomacea canaliculata]|uniref:ARID domain-containing protein n=1 Tax=Pomacea canaliculata TaxID=400727 RepID=A0A2T7NYN9_POMCA|nr:hypothetical protein C0Q70_13941 [Pomacea canaliculata]